MDIQNMKEGDIAGLAVFQDPYAYIGIKKVKNQNYIVMVNNGTTIDSSVVKGSTIYLRASAMFGSGAALLYSGKAASVTGDASFSYSIDNTSFVKIGNDLTMKFNLKIFTGNKFSLFNFATNTIGGYVDFDWFKTNCEPVTRVTK
jgi:beta-xylosidase